MSKRQPGHQPVRQHLGRHDQAYWMRAGKHLFKGAVFEIRAEQAVLRQHGRQQRRHPDNAGRNLTQYVQFRPDTEWKQAHRDDEEQQGVDPLARRPRRQGEVSTQ